MFNFETKNLIVNLLYSSGGIATQIVYIDKSENSPNGILMDIGDGTVRDILANHFNLDWFNYILLTHGHIDHIGGLLSFLGAKRMLGTTHELTIVHPKKMREIEDLINVFHKINPELVKFKITLIPCSISEVSEIRINSSTMIKSFPVIHKSSTRIKGEFKNIPALGFQIHSIKQNFTVAYSGDTGPTPMLYNLFNSNVDIAFIEATNPDDSWNNDKNNRSHLTEQEALEFTKNCKQRILIHKLLPKLLLNR